MNTETLVISNYYPEYKIPGIKGLVVIEEAFDPYRFKESLEMAELFQSQACEIDNKAFKGFLRKFKKWGYKIADFDKTEPSNLAIIRFQPKDLKELPELVTRYLQEFKSYLLESAREMEGDDYFYDYLPSIYDIFYQIAKVYNRKEAWEDLLKQTDKIFNMKPRCSGKEFREDALYRVHF